MKPKSVLDTLNLIDARACSLLLVFTYSSFYTPRKYLFTLFLYQATIKMWLGNHTTIFISRIVESQQDNVSKVVGKVELVCLQPFDPKTIVYIFKVLE